MEERPSCTCSRRRLWAVLCFLSAMDFSSDSEDEVINLSDPDAGMSSGESNGECDTESG